MIITIDGYVGTGKGTTAKGVAKQLDFFCYDSGAVWRMTALYAIRHNLLDALDEEKVAILDKVKFSFKYNADTDHNDAYLDGENVESLIRQTTLSSKMKPLVTCMPLREAILKVHRSFAENQSIVADGRDCGTLIFPDAELKIFLTCDPEVRLQRRMQQLQAMGLIVDENAIRADIESRDQTDYLGEDAVNTKAVDAIEIDTTHTSIEEQIAIVINLAKEKYST